MEGWRGGGGGVEGETGRTYRNHKERRKETVEKNRNKPLSGKPLVVQF